MYYADIDENFRDLLRDLPEAERKKYQEMKFARVEACFDSRIFIAYALDEKGDLVWRDTIEVVDFEATSDEGMSISLTNKEGKTEIVGCTPTRIFNLDLFVHIPVKLHVTWSLHRKTGLRSLLYALQIITKTDADKNVPGVHYLATLKQFRLKFPHIEI